MGVSRYTRVCTARARSSYSHTYTRVWTLHAPILTTGNYLRVHMRKRQVTRVRKPCSYSYGSKSPANEILLALLAQIS